MRLVDFKLNAMLDTSSLDLLGRLKKHCIVLAQAGEN